MIRRFLLLLMCFLPAIAHAQDEAESPLSSLRVITPENAAELVQVGRLGNGVVHSITWSPDGTSLLIASSIGVWVYDAAAPENTPTLLELPAGASSVAASARHIAAGSEDGTIHVWNIHTLETLTVFEGHLYEVGSLGFSADGTRLATGDNSGVVRLWNMDQLTEFTTLASLGQPYSAGSELLFNPSGESFARVGYCDSVELVTFEPSVTPSNLEGFMCPLNTLAFTGSDTLIAASDIGSAYSWNLLTQTVEAHPNPEALPETAEASNPAGTLIAVGGNDGMVRLLDADTREERARLFGHIRAVNGVAFSADGRLIASASLDRTIQIWDVDAALASPDTPALVMLEAHTSGVNAVAFNADATLLASAGYDGMVRLWGIPQ